MEHLAREGTQTPITYDASGAAMDKIREQFEKEILAERLSINYFAPSSDEHQDHNDSDYAKMQIPGDEMETLVGMRVTR